MGNTIGVLFHIFLNPFLYLSAWNQQIYFSTFTDAPIALLPSTTNLWCQTLMNTFQINTIGARSSQQLFWVEIM